VATIVIHHLDGTHRDPLNDDWVASTALVLDETITPMIRAAVPQRNMP
jgi:hypothetical protein